MSEGFLQRLYRRLFMNAAQTPSNRAIRSDSGTLNATPEELKAAIKSAASIRYSRLPENVPGKYYVTDGCTDCDACRATAPDNFRRHDEKGYSYVFQQPRNEQEESLCRAAMEGCPTSDIHDDGERLDIKSY